MGRREKDGISSPLRRNRREHSTTSLSDFARRIGYTPSYLSAVELGHLPPSPDVILAYEVGLGLTPGALTQGRISVAQMIGGGARAFPPFTGGPKPGSPATTGKLAMRDRGEVLAAMANLLVEAAESEITPGLIYICAGNINAELAAWPELRHQWQFAMRQVLAGGWQIRQSFDLDDDEDRSLQVIESLFVILGSEGDYVPLRNNRNEAAGNSQILVAEGLGGVLALDIGSTQNLLLTVREPSEVDALGAFCREQTESASPFLAKVSRDEQLNFERLLRGVESARGDRYLVREGTLAMLAPASWYQPGSAWARRTGLEGGDLDEILNLRRQRLMDFDAQLASVSFRDITTKRSILRLLADGFGPLPEMAVADQRQELVELLDHAITWLTEHPSHELALLDDDEVRLLQPAEDQSVVFWMVKGSETMLLETWPVADDGQVTHVHVAMKGAAVAGAFAGHFRKVWNRIRPRNRERRYVIAWLETQLELLKARSAEAG